MWVLGTKPTSSGRAAGLLATEPSLQPFSQIHLLCYISVFIAFMFLNISITFLNHSEVYFETVCLFITVYFSGFLKNEDIPLV